MRLAVASCRYSSLSLCFIHLLQLRIDRSRRLVILMTMSVVSLAEVKSHLSDLVGRVTTQHERVTVTVHAVRWRSSVAVDDLESLEGTIAVLSDSDSVRQLVASEAELAQGKGESQEQLAEAIKRRRTSL